MKNNVTTQMSSKIKRQQKHKTLTLAEMLKVPLLSVPLFLSACSSNDNTSDLREYVANIKARPAGRVKPLPEITPYDTYLYQVSHRRDPFTIFVTRADSRSDINEAGLHPDLNRKREELEQYSLDTLSFVGHIEKNKTTWALITAPDGIIYRVLPGNHMGSNYGKVLAVTEDKILLNEIIPNGVGGWTEREASLNINGVSE